MNFNRAFTSRLDFRSFSFASGCDALGDGASGVLHEKDFLKSRIKWGAVGDDLAAMP